VTLIDSADLRERTCLKCGAVYGDALSHRRWHLTLEEQWDTVLAILRGLNEQCDLLAESLRPDRLENPCL
jgi:aminoglycoside phosphotransferase